MAPSDALGLPFASSLPGAANLLDFLIELPRDAVPGLDSSAEYPICFQAMSGAGWQLCANGFASVATRATVTNTFRFLLLGTTLGASHLVALVAPNQLLDEAVVA